MEASLDKNSNAGKEFKHATLQSEKIILVVLDEELLDQKKWYGTFVGFQQSTAVYIDFTTEEKVKENMPLLIKRVEEIKQKTL